MADRRADQRYGKHTETRPGIPVAKGSAAKYRKRTWNKQCEINSQYRPGEIWLVHARRNNGPSTVHWVLIGEVPAEWEKKHKTCPFCPRMRTKLAFATEGLTSLEEMQENFLQLRNGVLYEPDWVANLKLDWQAGYLTMVRPIAFEEWKGINEREKLPPIPARPLRAGALIVDQHSFRSHDND